jgi:hypothetical protein
MRNSIIPVLLAMLAGCAYLPGEATRMQLTARDGGAVYYGTVKRTDPAVVNITVEIDRRTYRGDLTRTFPNETFGLYAQYGRRDAPAKTAQDLSRMNYTKAILSSTDGRILTCDFTDEGGPEVSGLCADNARRVFDAVLSRGA